MSVEPNELESRRFGVRFARLNDLPTDADDLGHVLAAADAGGVQVISTRVDATDLRAVRLLEDAGFRLMDTLVYCRRPLRSGNAADGASEQVVGLDATDAPACADVARQAFHDYVGHYHADPRLSGDAADEAYADWASRLLRDPAPDQVALGVRVAGSVAGFLVGIGRGSGTSEIILNAVLPSCEGAGLYARMLRHYLSVVEARGDDEVVISTQLQNYRVQRAWVREGFAPFRSYHTLHRWVPER